MAAPLVSLPPVLSPAHNHKPFPPRKPISPLYGASRPKTQSSFRPETAKCWKLSSSKNGVFTVSAASPVEVPQEIVSTGGGGGDGVSTVISALLLIAFIGLSILSIGVIYIAVTDFLQKRERERFEKEEASKKKKKRRKVRARARAGPRGFGEKVGGEDDDDGVHGTG